MWVSKADEKDVGCLGELPFSIGGGDNFLVEVVNRGHRRASFYYPEMWVLNNIKHLDYQPPNAVRLTDSWERTEDGCKVYSLDESGTLTFLFCPIEGDKFARVDLSDTLHRFTYYRTLKGWVRWWRGRLSTNKAVYYELRDAFARRDRPRHRKNV